MIPLSLLQDNQIDRINQKIAEAPDSSYSIGVVIGNLLPFVVLVILAYLLYSYMKNKPQDENPLED